jgi:ribosomal protein S18 acetylase RimI-like enzyme
LTYIGVAPETRGRGIGRALLNAFIEAGHSFDFDSIELSVETDNLKALALFTESDFAIIRTFREGRYDRYRMARGL